MLNFIVPEYRLVLLNSGQAYELTKCVVSFTFSRPRVDVTTPYSWGGNISLAQPLDNSFLPNPYFLDDLSPQNPLKHVWFRGVSQLIFYLKGKRLITLRISEYYYNEDDNTAEITAVDLLTLLDFKTPSKDYKNMGFTPCRSVSLVEIIQKSFQEAGITQYALSGSFGTIPVPPNKPGSSWVKFVQGYLGERGYWLYLDEFEVVRVVKYNPDTGSILFVRSRQNVENYSREKSPQIPADKYTIVGTVEKFVNCLEEDVSVSESFGENQNGVKVLNSRETRKVSRSSSGKEKIIEIMLEQSLATLFPKKYPNNYFMTLVSKTIRTETYDDEGKFIKVYEETDKLLGAALPDVFENDQTWFDKAETITEEYRDTPFGTTTVGSKKNDNVLRAKRKITTGLFAEGTFATKTKNGTVPLNKPNIRRLPKEQIDENWRQPGKGSIVPFGNNYLSADEEAGDVKCNDYIYQIDTSVRKQSQVSAKQRYFITTDNLYTQDLPYWEYSGLLLQNRDTKYNVAPGNWATGEAKCPTAQGNLKTVVKVSPISGTKFYEREAEVTANNLTTLAEIREYGKFVSSLAYQRYYGRSISIPIPDEFLFNSVPFTQAYIHNARYVIDAPTIILSENEMEFSFTGNYLGAMPTIVDPVELISISPVNFQININNISTYTNTNIANKIDIYNGVKPYQFNLTTSLNSLYIDNGYLVGVIAQTGNYQATIQVTDAIAQVATKTIQISVQAMEEAQSQIVIYDILNIDFTIVNEIGDPIKTEYDTLISDTISQGIIIDVLIEKTISNAEIIVYQTAVSTDVTQAFDIYAVNQTQLIANSISYAIIQQNFSLDVLTATTIQYGIANDYPLWQNTGILTSTFVYVDFLFDAQNISIPRQYVNVFSIQAAVVLNLATVSGIRHLSIIP